jgi:DNA-binding transcriptional ArsR family regulator
MDGSASKAKRLRLKDFEILDSIERVKSMAHEERLAMISALTEAPLTGAMVARKLGLPVSRAHYHLQRLLENGLIQEAGRGRKRWKEERYFVATARNFLVHPRLACRDGATAAALERSAEAAFLDWRLARCWDRPRGRGAPHRPAAPARVRRGEVLFFGPPSNDLGRLIGRARGLRRRSPSSMVAKRRPPDSIATRANRSPRSTHRLPTSIVSLMRSSS